jgi:hypothetical protein
MVTGLKYLALNIQFVLKKVLKELNLEISQIQKSLGDGNCEDYPRYQQMVGSITGLNMAIAITKNVYKNMIDGDDDENT